MDGFSLSPKISPSLRLVETEGALSLDQAKVRHARLQAERATQRVAAENRRASAVSDPRVISDADLREVFAQRASEMLEGGRAAILRAERRRRLVQTASSMGIAPFEANLIIALTQDAARRGERRVSAATRQTLRMIPSRPAPWWARPATQAVLRPMLASAVLGALLMLIAIEWLAGR